MTYTDLIRTYGNGAEAGRQLGFSRALVWTWKDRGIPVKRQVEIQYKTNGRLKAELPKFNGRKR